MTTQDLQLIEVGRTAGAYGVRGWVRIMPHGRDGDFLFETQNWWLLPYPRRAGVAARRLTVTEMKEHGKDLIVRLAQVATREDAMALKGSILIDPNDLPELEEGDFYDHEILGFTVVNAQNEVLGTLKTVTDNGAHDLLVVTPTDEKFADFMIPFVPAYVEDIDKEKRQIHVDWSTDWI